MITEVNRIIGTHGDRIRRVETREWKSVCSGDPNGRIYGQKGVFCLDYENWHLYANDSEIAGSSWINLGRLVDHTHDVPYTRQILWYVASIPLVTGADLSATVVYRGADITLTQWDLQVKTAPTGASLIADIHRGINSLWFVYPALRPTIVAGATTGTGYGFDIDTLEDGDVLKLHIDQIGSTIAGAQMTLILTGTTHATAT